MTDGQPPSLHVGSVTAGPGGQAVGINYGTVIQHNFTGPFTLLRQATISLDLLPADMGLVDPQRPDELFGLFHGRQWLLDRIDAFLDACVRDRVGGYLFVEGEAGTGKSALAAFLAFTRGWPAHVTRLPGGTSPDIARTNLAAQLIARWQLNDAAPGGVLPAGHDTTPWLYQRLIDAAAQRDTVEPGAPVVLLVDGLDEAPTPPAGELPLGLPTTLPPGCAVVALTRPGVRLPHRVGRVERIDVDSGLNRSDLAGYLERVLHRDPVVASAIDAAGMSRAAFSTRLLQAADGVWIYLVTVLDQIRQGRPATAVESLPSGLAAYYADNIERWQDTPAIAWDHIGSALLATTAAAGEPMPAAQLAQWAGVDVAAARSLLRGPFRPFLVTRPGGDPDCYGLRHESLREFCHGLLPDGLDRSGLRALAYDLASATRAAHARITRALAPGGPADAGEYGRHHLMRHAAAAGLLDELVTDPAVLLAVPIAEVVRRRRDLTSPAGRAAVGALELAANSWTASADRGQWLQVSARKLGCHDLADRVVPYTRSAWSARWAFWQGVGARRLAEHTNAVRAFAVLELTDGRQMLASGSEDSAVLLWDPDSGQMRAVLDGHDGHVIDLAVVRRPDGRPLLASAGGDETVYMWDPERGEVHTIIDDLGRIMTLGVARLPDGRERLAIGGDDGVVHLWDPADGEIAAELDGHTDYVRTFAAWNGMLASGSADGTVRLWNADSGAPGHILRGHTGLVMALAEIGLRDGRRLLASASADMTVRLWDPDASRIETVLDGHTALVAALAVVESADGRTLLASAGFEPTIRVWDPERGDLHCVLDGHAGVVTHLAVVGLLDGRRLLVSAGSDGTVRLWDPATGSAEAVLRTDGWVTELAGVTMSDGRQLIAAAADSTLIWLWDADSAASGSATGGHAGRVTGLAATVLPDGRCLIASASADGTVRLADPVTGATHAVLEGHTAGVDVLATVDLEDRPTLLASAGDDATVRLWDPLTGRQEGRLDGHTAGVLALLPLDLPDGRPVLASAGQDSTIRLWDPITGDALAVLSGHTDYVTHLATVRLRDGQPILASGGSDGIVRLWDPVAGRLRHALPAHGMICALTGFVRSDGAPVLASSGSDGVIRLWDPADGEPLETLEGHTEPVRWLAVVSSDRLASASLDGTVRLWDPVTGEALATFDGHAGFVTALAVGQAPDGTPMLISGDERGTVRVWDPDGGPAVSEIEGHTDAVTALAVVELPDGQIALVSAAADRCILIWSCSTK
ncbi:MAG TPA: AAA family ATPase [Micromonosporaceae bacterium]